MTKENKKSTDPSDTLSESKLWDEIIKALVYNMPDQLFPLIQEIYGISYPKGTSVQFLSTEQPQIPAGASLTSQFMDLTVLINGTDYYHLECQMKNDHQMVIRMLSYDLHFAMQYCAGEDTTNGEMILHFPRSVVLYPEKNSRIPDHLRCRIIFQDNSEHLYQIPTVKMQEYSLEEIRNKHLILFIPYVLLRLRPELRKHKQINKDELTSLVSSVIVMLDEEVKLHNITEAQRSDVIDLFMRASKKIFKNYPEYRKEVSAMTELKIKTLSMQVAEKVDEIVPKLVAEQVAEIVPQRVAEQVAEIVPQRVAEQVAEQTAEKDAELEKQRAEIAAQQAEIQSLRKKIAKLAASKNPQ